MQRATHLVLVNLGTPTAPTAEAIRVFLDEFLSDRSVVDYPVWFWKPFLRRVVLRSRPARIAHQYASIWMKGGSPLRLATERMAEAVRASSPSDLEVHVAYRYGEPSLDTVMQGLGRGAVTRVVVVPLFPQRTGPTTGTALKRAREAGVRAGVAECLVERVLAPDDPGYVEAMVARWNQATFAAVRAPQHVVVSFHGIPRRFNWSERSLYVRDCEATMRAFLHAIQWPAQRATLAFQSKFGPEPWLTPSTAEVLEALPGCGVKSVAVITPGFVTEGLETLEEIGIRGDASFRAAGGEHLLRIGAVEDHPAFVASLAALAR